ncbi:MAG: hypothetical protein AAF699_21450 [Pseudomonadota bacterium]
MSKAKVFVGVFFTVLNLSCLSQQASADNIKTQSLSLIVLAYLDAYAAINQVDSDADDFKAFNHLFSDDVVYEIPSQNMRFEADEFLSSDVTTGRIRNTRIILDSLIVSDVTAFAKISQFSEVKTSEGAWRPIVRQELLVFEIQNGKIHRIIDY